jgi:sterol desaturase/sphingolipid hydroxylase (fatty acid hydroxylase superfamily)
MAYHQAFWATSATVASAILVATAVALGQSVDTMVERVRQRRVRHERAGSRRWSRDRRRRLALSYVYALASIGLTMLALFLAMICLLNNSDVLPPWVGATSLFAGVVLIFLQVFAAADAKLAQARSAPDDDDAADLT